MQGHRPADAQLEQAAALIDYSFEAIGAAPGPPLNQTYYREAHDDNIRCVMQWLLSAQQG